GSRSHANAPCPARERPTQAGEGMTEQILDRSPLGATSFEADEWTTLDPADVVEVPLLLSGRQMLALEEAAHHRGLTAGEMVRHLLQDFIARTLACKVV